MKPDIKAVFDGLPSFLTHAEFVSIEINQTGTDVSGNIHVDGKNCAAAIALRSDGQCTIIFLDLKTHQKKSNRYIFADTQEAISIIAAEIVAAMEFA